MIRIIRAVGGVEESGDWWGGILLICHGNAEENKKKSRFFKGFGHLKENFRTNLGQIW